MQLKTVLFDGVEVAHDVFNDVKVILDEEHPDMDGLERHITITHEGIIVDIVNTKGEIIRTMAIYHYHFEG